ncbi:MULTISPECIES: hypothetical protein [Sphingomonas]|uniref:Uncharacterized protein n=1 Tax=Sphingomonas kyeonggiensis TaxID=1268553 RepID=A0A7W7K271_9SPHN|nr:MULTISPECIES: hypothetical protein [Sphingomonas]MBB4839692.1 hypothetical protein [Sphingomonas kyeonggiensis]WHU03104.1 hypothetical protein O3305_00365 [Sphingomonas sp. NIBR02145]
MAGIHISNRRALKKLERAHGGETHKANIMLAKVGFDYFEKLEAVRRATNLPLENGFGPSPHNPAGVLGTTYRKDVNTLPLYFVEVAQALSATSQYSFDPNAIPVAAAIKETLSAFQVRIFKLAKP